MIEGVKTCISSYLTSRGLVLLFSDYTMNYVCLADPQSESKPGDERRALLKVCCQEVDDPTDNRANAWGPLNTICILRVEKVLEPGRHPSPVYTYEIERAVVLFEIITTRFTGPVTELHIHTWSTTKMPPNTKARALAPFFTKTPAHTPHIVPNVSSYAFTDD